MHQEVQSQTNIFKTERKQCSKKSPSILIYKSKTSPRVTQKMMERNSDPLYVQVLLVISTHINS
jgi:hypothetical protein